MKRLTFFKSAVTGQFVSKAYAKAHPSTTYRMTLRDWRKHFTNR